MKTKSNRKDGRGHWPEGKRRGGLTLAEHARVIAAIDRGIKDHGSIRAVARALKKSDRTVRRLRSGEDWPTKATARKILASL